MKKFIPVLALICVFASPALAWNCSDPLASRVDVGSTKPAGTAGDGDGQYYIGSDATNPKDYYVCKVPTPPVTPPPTSGNQSQNQSQSNSQNQSQNTSVNSTQNTSNQNTSTSGSASKSNSNSNSQSNNSNSNSNVNSLSPVLKSTNTANGGQGGSSTATSNSAATNNGNNANNASYNSQTTINEARIPVATAFANAQSTVSCFKGFGAGGQTPLFGASFSGGSIDKNCAILEAARFGALSGSRIAFCKVYITDKAVKAAGVTLADCLNVPPPPVLVPVPVVAPPQPQITIPITVVPVPAPAAPVVENRLTPVLHTVGTCTFSATGRPTNVCYRLLDDAVRTLNTYPDARIVLTGPVESGRVVPYLNNRVSRSRIEIRLADEQDWTLKVQTETGE